MPVHSLFLLGEVKVRLVGEFAMPEEGDLNPTCASALPFDSAQGERPHPGMDSGSGPE